jgi:YgiT-type zinc finger domain-containing protein
MECVICKNGETEIGRVNVTLQRDDIAIIFKKVPADVCNNCGEYYLTEEITDQILKKAEDAIKNGAEVEILNYKAA